MEIIIPGDLEKARKKKLRPLQFTCPDCECIFVADNSEYEWSSQWESGPYATCPCCGRKNIDYNTKAEFPYYLKECALMEVE